jgi:hypothetical protein
MTGTTDDSARRLFGESVRGAAASADLDRALDSLGWADALAEDPQLAVSVLFEEQGRAGARSSALDLVMTSALGLAPGPALVLPRTGAECPGRGERRGAVARVDAVGLVLSPTQDVLVACAGGAEEFVAAVPASAVTVRPVGGLDPRLGLAEVQVADAAAEVVAPAGSWSTAVAAGHRALAHELTGAARAMLDLATEHARTRIQFGRPIADFQAIRHRLADSLVAVEGMAAAAEAAWLAGDATSALLAKAIAGRNARIVARHAQQVLAGMGFTTEHPFHHYLRRTLVLDELLGSSVVLTRSLGARVLESRQLPAMLPL